MDIEYTYHRFKLPRNSGLALPIKKAEVDAALAKADVLKLDSLLIGNTNEPLATDITIIKAQMRGESRTGYVMEEQPSLDIYAVPKRCLGAIKEELVQGRWLNRMVLWLKQLETASSVIRDVYRRRELLFSNGTMFVLDESEKKVELP